MTRLDSIEARLAPTRPASNHGLLLDWDDARYLLAIARAARDLPMHIRVERLDHDGFPDGDAECTTCGEDWPCPDSEVIDALAELDRP